MNVYGISALTIALLAARVSADQSQIEPSIVNIDKDGSFAGVKLGDPITDEFIELSESELVVERKSYSSRGVIWYRHKDAPKTIDGAELRYVYYGFKDERLIEINLAFSSVAEAKERTQFLEQLETRFGGTRVTHEVWLWTGKHVGLDFSGYCGLDTCSLAYLYIFPKERLGKFAQTEKIPRAETSK